jgi:hypothetical protein
MIEKIREDGDLMGVVRRGVEILFDDIQHK